MLIIGIDPDTIKHGVAWVRDGQLVNLEKMATAELVARLVNDASEQQLIIKLEDINIYKPVFQRPGMNRNQMLRIAQNVGAVKYAASLLLAQLNAAGLIMNMITPLPKAKSGKRYNKEQFNKVTGWVGPSNGDTRDAAMIAINGKLQGRQELVACGKLA